jgi:hypothetical protein
MFYEYTPEWLEYLDRRAFLRDQSHTEENSMKKDKSRTNLQVNQEGVRGEWAAWQFLGGVWLEDRYNGKKVPDPGWDIVGPTGLHWEVKGTKYWTGYFGLKPESTLKADYGALTIVGPRGVEVRCWISRANWDAKHYMHPARYNDQPAVTQAMMRPFPTGRGKLVREISELACLDFSLTQS